MHKPESIQRAKVRLRNWRIGRTLLLAVFSLLVAGIVSSYMQVSHWWVLLVLAIFWGVVQPLLRRKAPRGVRWLGHNREVSPPPVSHTFEITVPCERCGDMNTGVEAAEWSGGDGTTRVFRSCGVCRHTQWWSGSAIPPRIRRWEHADAAGKSCTECGYSFAATPITPVDREGNVIVSSRRCPECGRQEFFRQRAVEETAAASVTPPRPPQIASRSAAGSGSAGA